MRKEGCSCNECKNCCKKISGIYKPDEVEKSANYLNIPLKDFLKRYCIVGYRENVFGKNEYIEFIYPARKGYEGTFETFSYPLSRGDCSLLDKKGLCKIHPAKPFECKKVFGCDKHDSKIPNYYRDIALKCWLKGWKNKTIHPDIVEFIKKVK